MSAPPPSGTTREVFLAFLRVGLISFGGPVAHIALMRDEFVRRREWLDDRAFLDLVAAANLVPGPTSTELALHLGGRRAGARGVLAAGLAFIVPASLIVLALAWAYVAYGSSPPVQALLLGVKPVVVAIVVLALLALARTLRTRPPLLALAAVATVAWLVGVHELAILAAAGALAGGSVVVARTAGRRAASFALLPLLPVPAAVAPAPVSLELLAAVFLKAGALLFGSGYVLLAFLRADLVERHAWLSDAQLLDAVAIGQLTPGPLFTSATFIGYLLGGVPGAVVATAAIFLPAFAFAALLPRVVSAARRRPVTARVLDGVVAASLGLMAGVAAVLARDALLRPEGEPDLVAVITALASLALLASRRAGPTALIAAGGAIGLARSAVPG